MKKTSLLALLFLALAARPAPALSEKGQEALKQLESALTAEASAENATDNNPGGMRSARKSMLPRILEILPNTDNPQWVESMTQLMPYFTSEAVTKNYATVRQEIRAEKEAANQEAVAKITALIEKAGGDVRAAKAPADLDGTIAELSPYRQRYNTGTISEELRTAYAQVEPTLQFVTYWQNYLAAQASGNRQQANEALRNISGNSSNPYLIPRSQILALIEQTNSKSSSDAAQKTEPPQEMIDNIAAQTKSLPDVENAIKELRKLQTSYRNSGGSRDAVNSLLQNLQSIDKTYQDFKAGLATNIETTGYNGGDLYNGVIARLRTELLLLMLPRYISAPEGTAAKPGEDPLHFLDRLAGEGKDRGDINLAYRSRETARLLQRGNSFSNYDLEGLRQYTAGQNQQAAGQYLPAVISYQTALKSGSDLVPAKAIGEQLEAIRAAHPKEYDDAMERFLNPPRNENFNSRSGYSTNPNPKYLPSGQPALLIPPAPVSSPTPTPKEKAEG